MLELLVNDDAWKSLPPDLQAIIETAAKAVNQDLLDEYTASNNKALKELIETHGVELRKLPDDVIAALRESSREVVAEIAEAEFRCQQRCWQQQKRVWQKHSSSKGWYSFTYF